MASDPNEADPAKCKRYANFTHNLQRAGFDGLYWTLFFLVLVLLWTSALLFQRAMLYETKHKSQPGYDEARSRRGMRRALAATTLMFWLAIVALVLQVFCLLCLEYCLGEDLMVLYWTTWTVLQLGSGVAIGGIVLALWHHLCDIRHPLWALALGTPVLVVAGVGNFIGLGIRTLWRRIFHHNRKDPAQGKTEKATNATSTPMESRQNSVASSTTAKAESSSQTSSGARPKVESEASHPDRLQSIETPDLEIGRSS